VGNYSDGMGSPPNYHKQPKLTPHDRDYIKATMRDAEDKVTTRKELALKYGVSVTTIRNTE